MRREYKWQWGAAAEFLYRELIRAYQLEHHEEPLIAYAKSKPGRKQNFALFVRITDLKKQGYTVREVQTQLAGEGIHRSIEAVESYLKTRRKRREPKRPLNLCTPYVENHKAILHVCVIAITISTWSISRTRAMMN